MTLYDCCLTNANIPFLLRLTTDGSMSKPRVVALKFQPTPECPGFLCMFDLLYRQPHRFISVTGLCFSKFFTVASSFCNDLNLRSPIFGPHNKWCNPPDIISHHQLHIVLHGMTRIAWTRWRQSRCIHWTQKERSKMKSSLLKASS